MIKKISGKKTVTAVEFSGEWVKSARVEITGKKRTLLDIYAAKMPQEEIPAFLKKSSRAKILINSIERQSVTIRFLTLPSVKPAEIDEMIEFQAEKQLPFPKNELIFGTKILRRDPNGYSRVMLTIAHRNVIQKRLALFNAAGVTPFKIALSSEAILGYFLRNHFSPPETQGPGTYCIIDLDHSGAEILIARGDELFFSRAVSLPGGSTAGLVEEVRRSLFALKKEKDFSGQEIRDIFISGCQGKRAQRLKEDLSGEFRANVILLPRFKDMEFSDKIDGLENLPDDVSFSNVLGLAADSEGLQVDLLPGHIKEQRKKRSRQRQAVYLAVMSSLIVACLFALQAMRFYQKKAYVERLDRQLAGIESQARQAKLVFDKLNIIKEQSRRDNSALEVLRECYKIIPQDVNLSMFSFDRKEGIILRGTSNTMAMIFKMVSILEKSDYLENVKVVYANKRKIGTQVIADFQIRGELRR